MGRLLHHCATCPSPQSLRADIHPQVSDLWKWSRGNALQFDLCWSCCNRSTSCVICVLSVCRWFRKHRSSITALRLVRLRSAAATTGLRESFILVLFATLSTNLKSLVVDNCSQVREAWPLCCVPAWPLQHVVVVVEFTSAVCALTLVSSRGNRVIEGIICLQVLPSSQLAVIASLRALRSLQLNLSQPVCKSLLRPLSLFSCWQCAWWDDAMLRCYMARQS